LPALGTQKVCSPHIYLFLFSFIRE